MKRIFLAAAILALVFPVLRQAEARTDISIDFFYDNLGDGGNWIEAGEYGYCWQPTVASNASWRPYSDGYWAYTDVGWTWVSYEDFGWATYHYGRWVRLKGRGWVWAPGREWGPAWVSWRTGGDYVGWAPLPPRRGGDIYVDFSPITAQVDVDFDIGPAYYNFIDVRYIGEPVLRERIFAADQNVTYVSKTVNVTNITYNNSQVYNYGPDYNTLSRYSTRPIQKLTLQRETNADPLAAARSKSLMKVQGDKLVIAAPQQFQKPPKPDRAESGEGKAGAGARGARLGTNLRSKGADRIEGKDEEGGPEVRASADRAGLRKGCDQSGRDSASDDKRERHASNDNGKSDRGGQLSPAATGTPATAASPSASPAKDKHNNKRDDKVLPAPSASASVNPAMTPGKNKNKQNEKVSPLATPSASVPPATSPAPTRDKGKNKQRENVAPSASVPPATPTRPSVAPKPPKQKPEKPKNESIVPPPLDARRKAPRA